MLRDHKILYTLKLEDSMHKFVAKIMCIEEIENKCTYIGLLPTPFLSKKKYNLYKSMCMHVWMYLFFSRITYTSKICIFTIFIRLRFALKVFKNFNKFIII